MAPLNGCFGFAPPSNDRALSRRHAVELIATVGLTISLVVAATAVSLGNRSVTRGELAARNAPPPAAALLDQVDPFDQTGPWFSLRAQQ